MKKLLLICLLAGCMPSYQYPDQEPELTIIVDNNNWNNAKVTLECQGMPRTPKMNVGFNRKTENIYTKNPCHNARVVVDLFASSEYWISPTLNVGIQDKVCLLIQQNLTLSTFVPCRYS